MSSSTILYLPASTITVGQQAAQDVPISAAPCFYMDIGDLNSDSRTYPLSSLFSLSTESVLSHSFDSRLWGSWLGATHQDHKHLQSAAPPPYFPQLLTQSVLRTHLVTACGINKSFTYMM